MNIKFFEDIKEDDVVGGKGASLAKMCQNDFNIPNGYVIKANLFNEFLIENNIKDKIQNLINKCKLDDEKGIEEISKQIQQVIANCNISNSMENQIMKIHNELNCKYVAVRSSATSEDGKNSAWAGQLETFLNVEKTNVVESVKKCWCSIFSPRALFYRIKNNDVSEIAVAVVVQKMIQSEISGIAFSINPTNNNQNEIIVESVFGLGEAIVSGKVTPDTYIINKNENKITSKEIKVQKTKLVKENKNNEWVLIQDGNLQKLNDELILKLVNIIKKIENFYGFPVDVEWGIENGEIYILQCRPITTVKNNKIRNIIDNISNSGEWKYYVTRKFNWFVENTEIYASKAKYQKELLGFEVVTKNYLVLNGDEYSLDKDFEEVCEKFESYFEKDINFFDKFANKEFEVVEEVKEYISYLKNKNLKDIDFNKIYAEMEKFNKEYIRSFIPGMTRPESFLEIRLKEELRKMKLEEEEIEKIFIKVSTCPNYGGLAYSEEPLDLLKIAIEMKKGNDIEKLLDKHIQKYSWIKAPVALEDTCFTKQDYLNRLNSLQEENIEEKIENIIRLRKRNDFEYDEILKKYDFSEKILKIMNAIRNFIYLRTYTTEYSDHLFYVGKQTIFKEISSRCNVEVEDLIMLNDQEILDIIKNKFTVKQEYKDIIDKRKTGFAITWLDEKIENYFGNDSLEIQTEIAKIYKMNDNQEKEKDIIYGTVANKGKVRGIARILLSYDDIYKVKKGDIVVATMTTPDYISAMEKAAGFITDEGGITCHAAIISREFNVPCIVGTLNATKEIKDGQLIELDGFSGEIHKLD